MRRLSSARVAIVYVIVSVVWILASDQVVLALFGDVEDMTGVQTTKGLLFVAASALLIHVLIARERRRWIAAERAEHRAAIRFEAVFRASPAGILITDVATRRYLDANDRFLALFGYRRGDVVGRTVGDVEFWVEPARRLPMLDELRKTGRVHDRIDAFRDANGNVRTMLWSAELLVLEGRERILAALVDLTDRTEAYEQTLVGWARALDLRDHETAGHALRVTDLAVELGRRLGLEAAALQDLKWGALLHDIGKIGVPDKVLNKPGPLDDDEVAVMRRHPGIARELLAPIAFLAGATDVAVHHHERWDGSGYPAGLVGEAIPRNARIFAVVDVWDALLSERPYRSAWTREEALAHLRAGSGTLFEPDVVACFLTMVDAGEGPSAEAPAG